MAIADSHAAKIKMPLKYAPEAIEKCRQLYVKYGGANFEAVEREMRKDYPRWRKRNLKPRGTSPGWIAGFEFDKALEAERREKPAADIENPDERRYQAVIRLADYWQEKALSGEEKAVEKFIKLTDQQIALRSKLQMETANFEIFVAAFELLVRWAKEIDAELAKLFYKRKEEFIERAATHYDKG